MSGFPHSQFRPIWIASYPRSGNTFLRILLQNIFQTPTYSLYNLEGQKFKDASAEPLEEAPQLPVDWQYRLTTAPDRPQLMIKTHGPPTDDGRAIYVVRDGRPAIHSYYYYHKKFSFEQPSLTEVIAGICQFGSWSQHYRSWNPKARARTLFIRYEDLVSQPEQVIPKLAEFTGLTPTAGRLPTFAELQKGNPNFFRRGQNTDFQTEWSAGQINLFNELHGQIMTELGYVLNTSSDPQASTVSEVAESAGRLHTRYLEQLETYRIATDRGAKDLERATKRLERETKRFRRLKYHWWTRLGRRLGFYKNFNAE